MLTAENQIQRAIDKTLRASGIYQTKPIMNLSQSLLIPVLFLFFCSG